MVLSLSYCYEVPNLFIRFEVGSLSKLILCTKLHKLNSYLRNVYPGTDEFGALSETAVGVHEYRTDDPEGDCIELVNGCQYGRCLLRPRPVSARPDAPKALVGHQLLQQPLSHTKPVVMCLQ